MTDEPPFEVPEDVLEAMRRPPGDRPRYPFERSWPSHVWSIGVPKIDLLGVDADGGLYWDGHPVEVRRGLSLTLWQKVGAVLAVVAALLGAIAASVSAVADSKEAFVGDTANDRRCLAIQVDMLSANPRRSDSPELFLALGCKPQGDNSVYAAAKKRAH